MNSQICQHILEKAITVTEQEGQLHIVNLGHKRKGYLNWFHLHCGTKLKGCAWPAQQCSAFPHNLTKRWQRIKSCPHQSLFIIYSIYHFLAATHLTSRSGKTSELKTKMGLRGGKGARVEKRGILFLQTITPTMTAWLAPAPLTGNFCKRIMWCWNTKLRRFIYETGYRSDMGPANKVTRPVLSSAFQILKS